jgi:hypothetical protein
MIRPSIEPCFHVGQRVRIRGGELCGIVREVAAWPRVTAYRVDWADASDPARLWLERELRFEV